MTAFLFFSTYIYYLAGLSGTVPAYRDSGDLIASIHTLGIAHPPGYALYVIIGKFFTMLMPFGNVAYRVNVMSAVFSAAAVALLYRLLLQLSREAKGLSLAIALLYATTPAVTALSRVAEMYTLSACLGVLIMFLLFSDHPKGASWAAFCLGLGLSVHFTLIFLVPLFFIRRRDTNLWHVLPYFCLGLCIFLYLPLRASQDPLLNWGDPSSWRNFWRVVTRADYGGLKLHPEQSILIWTPTSLGEQLLFFLRAYAAEWGWAALGTGLLGILRGLRSPLSRAHALWLLGSWVLSGPFFFLLSNLPLEEQSSAAILQPYLLLAGVLWAPFVFWGAHAIVSSVTHVRSASAWALFALLFVKPWTWAAARNDFYAYDYARNLLRALPQGAVLYEPDDPTHFAIQVLQVTEGRRRDITLLSFFRTRWGYEQIKKRSPDLLPPIPIASAPELQRLLWEYAARRRDFYAELPQKFGRMPYRSQGLVYRASIRPASIDDKALRRQAEALLGQTVRRGRYNTSAHRDFFTRHVIHYYAAAHNNLGLEYAADNDWAAARAHYRAALEIDPKLSAAWNNLGSASFAQGAYDEAYANFQRALQIEPKNEMVQKNAQIALQKKSKKL